MSKPKDNVIFQIAIKPKYSDLDGITIGIRLYNAVWSSLPISEEAMDEYTAQNANLSGTILANLKQEFPYYTYSLEGPHNVIMKHGFSDVKDYLQDHLKIRKFLYDKVLIRYYTPLQKRKDVHPTHQKGPRVYHLQEHLIKKKKK